MRRVSSLRSTEDCLSVSGLLYFTVLFLIGFFLSSPPWRIVQPSQTITRAFQSNLFHRRPLFDPVVEESVLEFLANLCHFLFFHLFKRLLWIMEIRRLTSAAIKLSQDLHRKEHLVHLDFWMSQDWVSVCFPQALMCLNVAVAAATDQFYRSDLLTKVSAKRKVSNNTNTL